jgi:hypothetical protein
MMRNDERPGNRVIPMRILMRENSSSSSPSCCMVYTRRHRDDLLSRSRRL